VIRFDGQSTSLDEVRAAAMTIPFLAERRLVVLTNPFARINTSSTVDHKRFTGMLDSIPPSTCLLLVIKDVYQGAKRGWKVMGDGSWLLEWAQGAGSHAYIESVSLPRLGEMPAWIMKEAKEMGGKFDGAAAAELANQVGTDTRYASQKILKLLTYVDFNRQVEVDDVQELTASGMQKTVFDMVDNMAVGNVAAALRVLHGLLEKEEAIYLFSMIVRQFRLLVKAREVLDAGIPIERHASEMKENPFVVRKIIPQARRFTMPQLEMIYHRLLEIDEAAKKGRMPLELAMDMLVVDLER